MSSYETEQIPKVGACSGGVQCAPVRGAGPATLALLSYFSLQRQFLASPVYWDEHGAGRKKS